MDKFFDSAVEFAKTVLMEKGEFSSMLLGESPSGEAIALCGIFENDTEKEMFLRAASVSFALNQVKRYVALSEAWMSHYPEGTKEAIRPSEDPNRKECLMAINVSKNKTNGVMYEIKRNKKGKISELALLSNLEDGVSGRFTELLLSDDAQIPGELVSFVSKFLKAYEVRFH